MILDRLKQANRYAGLQPGFRAAFEFLRSPQLVRLSDGRHEIDGSRLFVIMAHDVGKGQQGARLESHRKYIDVQYLISGRDVIGYRPAAECSQVAVAYDSGKDIAFYGDGPESWFLVPAGSFVIFYPEDAHAPLAGEGTVHKAVVKVAVNWD